MSRNMQSSGAEIPPNGPFAGVMLAAGAGSFVLGLSVVLCEWSPAVKAALNLHNGVGPLSGKSLAGSLAFLAIWALTATTLRGRNVNLPRWVGAGFVLLALGLLFTFPPFFERFSGH